MTLTAAYFMYITGSRNRAGGSAAYHSDVAHGAAGSTSIVRRMTIVLVSKVTGVLASAALAAAFAVAGPIPAAAAGGSYTCSGGSPSSPSVIPAATYQSITVTGFCVPDTGTVTVVKSLTIAPGAAFASSDASSTVTIGGSVDVQEGGVLILGCGPTPDTLCNDPSATSQDTIHGNLASEGAALLIIHYDTIGGNVGVQGGGGGLNCDNFLFIDFDQNSIGGNASVTGLQTCWAGFSNNSIEGNVAYTNNHTVIDDGNFVGGNTIGRSLNCSGNSPTPHLSDGFPVPNSVAGHTSGQCVGEI